MKKIILILLLSIFSQNNSCSAAPESQNSPNNQQSVQGSINLATKSYAEIIDKTPEEAWHNLIEVFSQKADSIVLLKNMLIQIAPLLSDLHTNSLDKINDNLNQPDVSPETWKVHIIAIGNMAKEVGKIIVNHKGFGTALDKLSKATQPHEYSSFIPPLVAYSFMAGKTDPEVEKIKKEWKKVEKKIVRYLKKEKILKDRHPLQK